MALFKQAVKRNAKLRLAVSGPSGSGKTFTLLRLATELAKAANGRIAYVDTEHGSASKYAHTDKCGGPGACTAPDHFDFDVLEPEQFDPRELTQLIPTAAAEGYAVLCVDSLSHYWMGVGGELELVDTAAKQQAGRRGGEGNSFAAWKTVTPYHTALVDTIISASLHVLVSMRTKTEWVVEKNDNGKNVPRKIGTQPIMRDGIEFEFDVSGDMDQENSLIVTKSRCSALSGKVINRPGKDMALTLIEWLAGAPVQEKPAPLVSFSSSPAAVNPSIGITDDDVPTILGGTWAQTENPSEQYRQHALGVLQSGPAKPWSTRKEMKTVFENLRLKLESFDELGEEPFAASIFAAELGQSGVDSPDGFKSSADAIACFGRLQKRIETCEAISKRAATEEVAVQEEPHA